MKPLPPQKPLTVAGIMSGTSADGIDVALVRIRPGKSGPPRLRLLAHHAVPYPKALRQAVLDAMNAPSISTAQLARLNWRLGIAYADAVQKTLARHPHKLDLIGCHGQTLYHQPAPEAFLGARFPCTWQLGEPAILAGRLNTPVVSNFRPADIVAGGHGAPLVPLLDQVLFSHPTRGRVLQNIGGIANLTGIAPGGEELLAFDTGPGNMVLDALTDLLYHRPYDSGGRIALSGQVLAPVLAESLRHPFFRKSPPKTAGREQFGREFAADFLARCRKISPNPADALATAAALTAESIAQAYQRHAAPLMGSSRVDYIVSGGGARNLALMQALTSRLAPLNCRVTTSDTLGLPAEAKEAAAFALLAWQTWHHLPGNLPAATGASRPVLLGQVTYV